MPRIGVKRQRIDELDMTPKRAQNFSRFGVDDVDKTISIARRQAATIGVKRQRKDFLRRQFYRMTYDDF